MQVCDDSALNHGEQPVWSKKVYEKNRRGCMKKEKDPIIYKRQFTSPIGTICLEADAEALISLYIAGSPVAGRWENSDAKAEDKTEEPGKNGVELQEGKGTGLVPEELVCIEAEQNAQSAEETEERAAQAILDQAEIELLEYFYGLRTTFKVPFRMVGTEFQQKVWAALREIPYGETRTYAEVAQMIGNPKACRAVGGANNRNPIMILTPCHRVVGADGSLVGFGGGMEAKKYLLELEKQMCECDAAWEKRNADMAVEEKQLAEWEAASAGRKKLPVENGNEIENEYMGASGKSDTRIGETQAAYLCKKQGEYTLEDYYAWPDDERIELIDGYIFRMDAPTIAHQIVGFQICMHLYNYINTQNGTCLPLVSPVDVQLDRDDKTMLQPDVLVVCDRDKVINRCIYGAPEFVVEVVSASSVRKDTVIKLNKYKNAGVQEYWIVDLESRHVIVYDFFNDSPIQIYGIDSEIPVAIFGGECRISFAQIYEKIEFLLEGNEDAE